MIKMNKEYFKILHNNYYSYNFDDSFMDYFNKIIYLEEHKELICEILKDQILETIDDSVLQTYIKEGTTNNQDITI